MVVAMKKDPELEEIKDLALKIIRLIRHQDDQAIVAAALANAVSYWIMSYKSADLEAAARQRGDVFNNFVKAVGVIVDVHIRMESDQVGHA
jgi:hypothetical protein